MLIFGASAFLARAKESDKGLSNTRNVRFRLFAMSFSFFLSFSFFQHLAVQTKVFLKV